MSRSYRHRGMTLIEVMIFMILLSLLLFGFIEYTFTSQSKNMKLMNDIEKDFQSGFIATTAVLLLATGILAFMTVTASAAYWYSDSIYKKEARIQQNLNKEACNDVQALILYKDPLVTGDIEQKDLNCTIHI